MPIVVSDSNSEETLQAYAHPLSIQAKAISGLEERVLNGSVVADGNNVFTYLTEFAANTVADAVNKACMCFNSLYPENAQTTTDLYKHLSDFDYIGLYATPAELTIELIFDRKFLIDNCVQIPNSSYFKIVIPEYSKFTVGEYTFGLMYPIEIKIRKAYYSEDSVGEGVGQLRVDYDNCAMAVTWDTTNTNPLKTLDAHILEHRDFVQEGQTLTAIEVPIYQFEVENHVENAIASTGFAKRYDYLNKFYAVRVYHFKNGKWNEMEQTLSDINYDVDKPTAMIKVLMDIGKVEVVIPQIYFNTTNEDARIGNRVLVKIYNTQGELNLDISGYNTEQFGASFLMTDTILVEDDTYSEMLKRIPTIYMVPASRRISSGTDGITMSELKERVKHNASYTVKITPDDLDAYFATSGFTFTKELDNITDRVYCAHKVITDSTGTTIASGEGKTVFLPESLNIVENEETGLLYVPNYSSISVLDANNITIQPSAVYKYDSDSDSFTMLSDNDLSVFNAQTQEDKIAQLNAGLYTLCPFHIRMSLSDSLPIAGSYDVFNPSLKSIVFEWENPNTTAEIAIYTASIEALKTSDSGYRLNVALFKTDNISSVEPKVTDGLDIYNIQVMLSTTNSDGEFLYMLGTYNGKDSSKHDIFIFDIKSMFKITSKGMIDVTNMYDEMGDNSNKFIDIDEHKFELKFFIKEEFITDEYPMDGVSMENIPGTLDGYVHLCTQSFMLTLGSSLPLLKNNVALSTSNEQYQTYPTTQFATYDSNVYYRWTLTDYCEGAIDPVTEEPITSAKIGSLKLDREEINEYYITTDTTFKSSKDYYLRSGKGTEAEPYVYTKATFTAEGTALSGTYYELDDEGNYVVTTDPAVVAGKNYYILNGSTYVLSIRTVGAPIPEDTYYNFKKYKYSPCIQYNQGDVIITSPYGFTYGPVMSIINGDDINSLALDNSKVDYTVTSDLTNVWKSVDGDVFVIGSTYTTFTGMYNVLPNTSGIKSKVWWQSCYTSEEKYDDTTLKIFTALGDDGNPKKVVLYKYLDENGYTQYSDSVPLTTETYDILEFDLNNNEFKSSNSDIVKADSYVKSTSNVLVNTKARGDARKWFLVKKGSTDLDFDFENYTGFVIENAEVEATSIGLRKAWCLNFCYRTKDSSGLDAKGVVIINSDLPNSSTTTGTYLTDNDKTKLTTDAYITAYKTIYHKIYYKESPTGVKPGWYLGETKNADLSGVDDYYYAPAVVDPNGTLPQPWEAEWSNLRDYDVSELTVTCTNNTDTRYSTSINDALSFIIKYLKDNDQKYQSSSKLNKYINDAVLSEDTHVSSKKTYYTCERVDNPLKPYSYTAVTLESGKLLLTLTADTVFKANKTYFIYNDDDMTYEKAEVTVGEEIPENTYYDQIVYYEKCDPFLVDPLEGIIFTCVQTCGTITYTLTEDTLFSKGTDYYKRSGAGSELDPYVYTKWDLTPKGKSLSGKTYFELKSDGTYKQTVDTTVKLGKNYYVYENTVYVLAIITESATVPSETFYEKSIQTDSRTQEYCNSLINYSPIDSSGLPIPDTYDNTRRREVGTTDALGGLFYRTPDFIDFDIAAHGLTYDMLVAIIEAWNKYKIYSEAKRYQCVVDATGISLSLIKLVVSDTAPCFFTPWTKQVTLSSYNALCEYYDERVIVNCSITDLSYIQYDLKRDYKVFANLSELKSATFADTYRVVSGVFKSGVTYYTRSGSGTTEDPYVYTAATVVIGADIPEDTYYIATYQTVFVQDISELDETTTAAEQLRTWLGLSEGEGVSIWAAESILGTVTSPTCAFVKWGKGLLGDETKTSAIPIRCGYDEETCYSNIMSYGTCSGYMYVITQYPDSVTPTGTVKFINYTSKIDRTYVDENDETGNTTITRNEFNINFENSIWTEIDKWPWEIDTMWIDAETGKNSNITLYYNKSISCAKTLHLNTDYILDGEGNPILAANGSRSVIYTVDMLHCDYKLSLSDDADYATYITDIRELLRSYFNELNTVSPSLLARTKMYYTPIRTYGVSTFKGNGGTTLTLPLEFSVNLGLHVATYVNNSDLNKETIKTAILSIIDKKLKEGYLNLAMLAADIMDELSDNIICVDVFGINGDNSLQTMIPTDSDCFPQLKQALVLNDDGTISTVRRLDLTWYVIE